MQKTLSKHLIFWVCALLGIAVIYLPGLDSALFFDDVLLTDGTVFDGYGALAPLKQRLLSYGSFVWFAEIFGEGWWKQRLVNIAIHLVTVWGLWILVRGLIKHVTWPENDAGEQPSLASRDAAATVGVLLFAVNPVAVYAVAYLIQRSILMATLFGVWSLVLTMWAGQRKQPVWLLAALAAYVVAVLSKEHAVLLPLPAIALYLIVHPLSRRQLAIAGGVAVVSLAVAMWFLLQLYGGILGTVFDPNSAAFVTALKALKPGVEEEVYGLSMLNQAWLFFKYGLLWVVPNVQWMSVDLRPAFPLSLGEFPQVLGLPLYVALLAASVWLMWRFADWRRYVGFALFTPAVLFATEFATVWIQDPFVLYRSYLWAIGLPLLFALPFVGARPKTVFGIGLVLAAVFCALAFERVDSLKTEFSAWDDAARKIDLEAPANAVGRFRPFINRGNQFFMQERFTLASRDYETAIKLGDYDGTAEYHLGSLLQLTGKHEQALAAFKRVEAKGGMAHSPELLLIQQAQLFARMQRHAEALAQADKALGFTQLDDEGRLHMLDIRARSNLQLGRADAAFQDYEAMIALDPQNALHRINQALSLAYAGRHQEALDRLTAITTSDKESELHTARAVVLNMMGQRVAAINEARAALAARPDNPAPRVLLRQLGAE